MRSSIKFQGSCLSPNLKMSQLDVKASLTRRLFTWNNPPADSSPTLLRLSHVYSLTNLPTSWAFVDEAVTNLWLVGSFQSHSRGIY